MTETWTDPAHVARLATLGQMASALVHELAAPLSIISIVTERLTHLAEDRPDLEPLVKKLDAQTVRTLDIIRSFSAFGRKDVARQAEDIVELVRESTDMAMLPFRNSGVNVGITASVQHKVVVARTQIEQVVINLVRNAVEATELLAERQISIRIRDVADMVEVRITDNGPGIDPTMRLFEPFATTKPNGMGMGLMISHGIMLDHGGDLTLEPVSQGTCFCLRLPVEKTCMPTM